MPRVPRSPLLPLALVLLPLGVGLVACGESGGPTATVDTVGRTAAEREPAAAPASDLLGRLADVPAAHGRLAFVNAQTLADLDLPLPAREIREIVLGATGAARVVHGDDVRVAAQLGTATVLVDGAGRRQVIGAAPALAEQLASTTPPTSVLAPETASAVQSCLGDPAAEVIRGSEVLGPTSGMGVSVLDSADAPAGPKLRLCAAPHYVRDLHAVEDRLKARFPKAVVGEEEIGERDIVGATIAVDDLTTAQLRDLLRSGDALLSLARD